MSGFRVPGSMTLAATYQPMPPSSPPASNGQYDFILNPQSAPKRSPISGLPKPLLLVLFALGAITLIIIVASLLFGGGNSASKELIGVAKQQSEIIRISTDALAKAKDSNTRSIAATTIAVVQSDQNALKSYLAKNGSKVSPKSLTSPSASSNDSTLKTAEQSGHYDDQFLLLLASQLSSYRSSLKTNYATAGPTLKPTLGTAYNDANALLVGRPLSDIQSATTTP